MTDKTKTISVRLPVETVDELEKTLKKQGITLRNLLTGMANGEINAENFIPEDSSALSDGVYTQYVPLDEEIVRDIEKMAKCFGMTLEEMMEGVCEGLNCGSLTVLDGRVAGIPEIDLERLYEACHEANIDPQEAIDKLVKDMGKK